jgi:hypothetical protein
MPRIRSIKPELFRHEKLQDLEQSNPGSHPMLVFAGLFTVSDKCGRFEWKPRILKLDILPFLDFDMHNTLEILKDANFIVPYDIDGKQYGYIPTFKEHQRITGKEAQSPPRYPEPHQGNTGETPEKQPRSQEREREKEKERKGNGGNSIPEILEFWNSHPKLHQHRILSPIDYELIRNTLQTFSAEEIKLAIGRYALVLGNESGTYWLNTRWTIGEFVSVKGSKWPEIFISEDWEEQVLSSTEKKKRQKEKEESEIWDKAEAAIG